MIKAVIFDCFGVLTTEGWLAFKAEHFSQDEGLNREVTDLLKQANSGLISHERFVESVAKLARVTPKEVNQAIDVNKPNEPLFAYIDKLKPKYKIAMLSNAATNWLTELFSEKQIAKFDVISLSYELGVAKPDNEAYEQVAAKLELDPFDCVFIDDQERHCTGAKEAGMQAILYEDFEQMKTELEKTLTENPSS